MGPAKMPADAVKKNVADVHKVLADPAIQSRLSIAGIESLKLIRAEKIRFEQLTKSADIKAE